MKKCVVVCSENCKSRNVLFSENITKGIKNRMLEKINNVNVRFLVLSVYKVQNRPLFAAAAGETDLGGAADGRCAVRADPSGKAL